MSKWKKEAPKLEKVEDRPVTIKVPEKKPEQKEILGLPKKEYLRVDEVSDFFRVTDRTVRLWVEHGKLTAVKIGGVTRLTRESVIEFPIKMK